MIFVARAGGLDRYAQTDGLVVDGGGAGGWLLLEAPKAEFGPNARLLASGGNGAAPCTVATRAVRPWWQRSACWRRCHGGGDASCMGLVAIRKTTGGGGGGLGRVRVNTKDGDYVKSSQATVEDAAVTTGEIGTR